MIYEPQEDSLLLKEQVKKYSKGKVLDMGTGSGILGNAARESKNVTAVTYADINLEVKKHIQNVIITNLFNNIKGRFDTIIFNPPYLPKDENDREELITTGGKHGYELLVKFLKQSRNHLETNGIILIVFSSLTNKRVIDDAIKKLGYEKHLLSRERVFMEELYTYKIQEKENNILKGTRGVVEIKTARYNGRLIKVAIKRKRNNNYDPGAEARFLEMLNKSNIGPRLMSYDKDSITMEYVEGERIIDYLESHSKKQIYLVIKKILDQLYTMDHLKINKLELTHPYKHIIVRNSIPVQIDFERCQMTHRPKNITQFSQFLTSARLEHIFKEKGINIDRKKILAIARDYKMDYNKGRINDILGYIS